MCFSAEASLGVAVALLPVGGYCVAAALARDRAYLPLAAVPLLFGVQQVFEAGVWLGLGGGQPDLTRVASVGFLFFALAVWPVWVPLAVAALEPPGVKQLLLRGLAATGLVVCAVYFVPVASAGGRGIDARVVGHSVRYELAVTGWVWPALYLTAVCVPLAAARDRRVRPLGVLAAVAAVVAYAAFREAFASVWCFLAAALSAYLGSVLSRLPARPAGNLRTGTPATAL